MNLAGFLTVTLDGLAFGMLLFLFSIGLGITLGLMRFINLAHGAFAMCGGYLTVALTQRGAPFLLALAGAFFATGAIGVALERTLVRFVYQKSALQQVLFSIGLAFAAGAVAELIFGPQQQAIALPAWATQRVEAFGVETSGYRLFVLGAGALALPALWLLLERTLFGARVRAAVDNRRAAEGVGVNVERLFAVAFGLGAACAGFGGGLAVNALGLDPSFPFKYLVLVLMVVAIGGPGSISGAFVAALGLGLLQSWFECFRPDLGGLVIYAVLVATMLLRPQGFMGRAA